MASLIFDSLLNDVAHGNVNFSADTFYAMLVTSAYAPDKGAHSKRSNVSNEVVGTGYTAGGQAQAVSVALDTANHRLDITLANLSWPAATIDARGAVIYKHRGGAAAADELVGYADFGSDIISTGGTFAVSYSSPLRLQN
jgi:hypothetical protein